MIGRRIIDSGVLGDGLLAGNDASLALGGFFGGVEMSICVKKSN